MSSLISSLLATNAGRRLEKPGGVTAVRAALGEVRACFAEKQFPVVAGDDRFWAGGLLFAPCGEFVLFGKEGDVDALVEKGIDHVRGIVR